MIEGKGINKNIIKIMGGVKTKAGNMILTIGN